MKTYLTEKGNTTIHFASGHSIYLPFDTNSEALKWAKSVVNDFGGRFTYTIK